MTIAQSARAPQAFLLGAGLILIGPKFWVFTLTAVGAIRDASLGPLPAALTFLAYTALCSALLLTPTLARVLAPDASAHTLNATSQWLERHNQSLVVTLGLTFGTWFLIKALIGLDVI